MFFNSLSLTSFRQCQECTVTSTKCLSELRSGTFSASKPQQPSFQARNGTEQLRRVRAVARGLEAEPRDDELEARVVDTLRLEPLPAAVDLGTHGASTGASLAREKDEQRHVLTLLLYLRGTYFETVFLSNVKKE